MRSCAPLAFLFLAAMCTSAFADTVKQVAQEYLATGACSSSQQRYNVAVANYKKLDKTYGGVLPGVEVTEYTRVGDAGYANFFISPDGKLKFTLHAHGGGTRLKKFGVSVCVSPSGSSIGITVLGHFKD